MEKNMGVVMVHERRVRHHGKWWAGKPRCRRRWAGEGKAVVLWGRLASWEMGSG